MVLSLAKKLVEANRFREKSFWNCSLGNVWENPLAGRSSSAGSDREAARGVVGAIKDADVERVARWEKIQRKPA